MICVKILKKVHFGGFEMRYKVFIKALKGIKTQVSLSNLCLLKIDYLLNY
jgi:hypothetical protein